MRLQWIIVALLGSFAPNASKAQTTSPKTGDYRDALLAHKASLTRNEASTSVADTQATRLYNQGTSPVEFSDEPSVSLSGGYGVSSKDGRDLDIGEWTLGTRFTPRISAWFGHQSISAKGRNRVPIRSRFNTSAEHFGFRWVLKGTEARGLSFQYDTYHSGLGDVAAGNSAALIPGPKTDNFQFLYGFGRRGEEKPDLPTYRARFNLANVQGIGAGATSAGLGGGMTYRIRHNLTGDVDTIGLLEFRRDNISKTTFRLHSSAGVTYQPVAWAKLQANLEFSPFGVPLGGTSLSGLSSFGVYQRNDGVSGISNGAVAVFNLRLIVGTRF